MMAVMGNREPAAIAIRYATLGDFAARDIRAILAKNGLAIDKFEDILDFGCGSGRVIRYWRDVRGRVVGTDYNADLVDWCAKHLPFSFHVNDLDPPLRYPDGTFDFVYALSVFTHLDEARQVAWRDELLRVLRPGGFLLFTTLGSRFRGGLDENRRRDFDADEIVYMGEHSADVGKNDFGTFQSEAYVRGRLAAGTTIVDCVPWGAVGLGGQDLWLVQKPHDS